MKSGFVEKRWRGVIKCFVNGLIYSSKPLFSCQIRLQPVFLALFVPDLLFVVEFSEEVCPDFMVENSFDVVDSVGDWESDY